MTPCLAIPYLPPDICLEGLMNGVPITEGAHVKFLGKEINNFNLAEDLIYLMVQPDGCSLQVWQISHTSFYLR